MFVFIFGTKIKCNKKYNSVSLDDLQNSSRAVHRQLGCNKTQCKDISL